MPRISVIIVTWNALPLLKQCLPSVVASTYADLEIILADNASEDGTVAWVQTTYPQVKVVQHPENWAFCRGNNAAMTHATGEYVVLLNNDVEVTPGWLEPLAAVLDASPDVAAVQPKLLQYDDRQRFEYAGAAGGFVDRLGYPFTRGRIFFTMEPDAGQYDTSRDVLWATGAALMLRRSALDRVGLLDEQFFMHMEEIDLCWRLWRHGYRVRVEPVSVVYHIGGASLPQHDPRKAYFNFRNSLLTLYKNVSPATWRRILPRRAALDLLAFARSVATGNLREAIAIVRAYRDAHRMARAYADQRPARDAEHAPVYPRSIVLDYFMRGHKTFVDLPAQPKSIPPRHQDTFPKDPA